MVDAGCARHGCWYARDGFNDCYDSDDGHCILGYAVRPRPEPPFPGRDVPCPDPPAPWMSLSHLALQGSAVTEGRFSGSPFRPWQGRENLYTLHPASVVSGQAFELHYRPRPGRGLVHREVATPPAETRLHEQANYPDPEDGDVWYCPQGSWLFHAGQWRAVDGLRIDLVLDQPGVDIDGLVLPRTHDGTVRVLGVWR